MDSFYVKVSWIRPACYLFLGICLAICSALALTQPLPYADNPQLMKFMTGYVGGLGAAIICITNLYKLLFKRKAIVIDSAGIIDRTGFMSPGFIPWNDIQIIYLQKIQDEQFLCIQLYDYDAFVSRLYKHQKRLAQANIDAGYAPVRIQFRKVSNTVTVSDAIKFIKSLHPELIGKVQKVRVSPKLFRK